ncbi:DUF2314 domain-containing protein [Aliikangiella maris]|uniref:DUF2314 domain-containing protein n=2 Tax=Aliikangiella maris TaxID=3162458 RepID=A0ABV2BPZ1_9GAMM
MHSVNHDPDVVLLKNATNHAQLTLAQFRQYFKKYPESALVKIAVINDTQTIDRIVAHVVKIEQNSLTVLIVNSPEVNEAFYVGTMQFSLTQVEDWQVVDKQGHVYGAYIQKAMHSIGQKRGIELPSNYRYLCPCNCCCNSPVKPISSVFT